MAKADGNLSDKIAEKTTGSNVTGMDKKSILLETLKRRILSMELQPGTSIDEMTLCDEFGLSRSPVRELIRQMAAEGYLDALKHYVRFYNRGTVIGERDRKEFEQQLKDIDMLTVNGRIMSPYSDVLKTVDSFTGRVMAQKSVGNAVVSSGGVLSFSGNAMLVA